LSAHNGGPELDTDDLLIDGYNDVEDYLNSPDADHMGYDPTDHVDSGGFGGISRLRTKHEFMLDNVPLLFYPVYISCP
jgi:hypothetical protein